LDKVFNIIEKPIELSETAKLTRFQENTWPKFNPDNLKKDNVYLCGNWRGTWITRNAISSISFSSADLLHI
jgi:hypothetical protein